MLEQGRTTQVTTFPLFNLLPSEIRQHIWTYSLPGPRIIYIHRILNSGSDPNLVWFREPRLPPEPSYFTSTSPDSSLTPLLLACKESRQIVRKRYSLILKGGGMGTWFDFERDFFYVDWGRQYHGVPYSPRHFTESFSDDCWAEMYAHPEIEEDVARKVRNLVVYNRAQFAFLMRRKEDWLVRLLGVFTGVKVLVMADQSHDVHESGEELVWLRGELGDELREVSESGVIKEECYRLSLRNLLLWRDGTQYGQCQYVDQRYFERDWYQYAVTESCEIPEIIMRSVTTSKLKNRLLSICGSEDNFRELEGLDWEFVMGEHGYDGDLDLSQQIAYLELVLERISTEVVSDDEGCAVEGALLQDIPFLVARIDKLLFEWEMTELVISEAEQIVWE